MATGARADVSDLRVRKGEPYLPLSDDLLRWWDQLGLSLLERGLLIELVRVQVDGFLGADVTRACRACSAGVRSARSVERLIARGALLQTDRGVEIARWLDYYLSTAEARAKMQAQTAGARAARQSRARQRGALFTE